MSNKYTLLSKTSFTNYAPTIFFRKLSQNPEYIQTHCNDRTNPFHFACRNWYLYKNQQCC